MIHPFNITLKKADGKYHREIIVTPQRSSVPIEGVDYPVVTFNVRVYPLPRVLYSDWEERFISESVVPDLSALWQLVTAELVGGEEE